MDVKFYANYTGRQSRKILLKLHRITMIKAVGFWTLITGQLPKPKLQPQYLTVLVGLASFGIGDWLPVTCKSYTLRVNQHNCKTKFDWLLVWRNVACVQLPYARGISAMGTTWELRENGQCRCPRSVRHIDTSSGTFPPSECTFATWLRRILREKYFKTCKANLPFTMILWTPKFQTLTVVYGMLSSECLKGYPVTAFG